MTTVDNMSAGMGKIRGDGAGKEKALIQIISEAQLMTLELPDSNASELRGKVAALASKILEKLEGYEISLEGFRVVTFHTRSNREIPYLVWQDNYLEITSSQYIDGDFDLWVDAPPLDEIVRFCQAIDDGLLDRLRLAMENRNAQNKALTDSLPEAFTQT